MSRLCIINYTFIGRSAEQYGEFRFEEGSAIKDASNDAKAHIARATDLDFIISTFG